MFIHPETLDTSHDPLAGYLPLINEDPADTSNYTLHGTAVLTVYADRVTFSYYLPKHLETLKSEAIERINTQFELDTNVGFSAIGYEFDSDEASLFRVLAVYTFASNNPSFNTSWITKDNQILHLTNADILALGIAAMIFQTTLIMTRRMAKDAVLACSTLEQLQNL